MDKTNYKKIHTELGCHGCFFADRAALDKSLCCTCPGEGNLDVTQPDGEQCLNRRVTTSEPGDCDSE